MDPNEDVKILWEKTNDEIGILEIGDGSTCFEHCFEFWGTWKVKPEMDERFLSNSKIWPKGIKIVDVKTK